MQGILVWAHRGASAYAPENTLPAFAEAAAMGADGVELDVQLTKDGEIVVIHDENLDRVSNGSGWVKDYTLDQLKGFCYNKARPEWDGPASEAVIPTLKEVYELLAPTGLTVNVELKTGIFLYEGILDKVLELTAACGMEDRVIYSSFNHYSLIQLKGLDPKVRTGMLYSDTLVGAAAYAKERLNVDALHPAVYHLSQAENTKGAFGVHDWKPESGEPSYVDLAHQYGLKTHVWTVDDPQLIRMCAAIGTEAIITNKPDFCRSVLEAM